MVQDGPHGSASASALHHLGDNQHGMDVGVSNTYSSSHDLPVADYRESFTISSPLVLLCSLFAFISICCEWGTAMVKNYRDFTIIIIMRTGSS